MTKTSKSEKCVNCEGITFYYSSKTIGDGGAGHVHACRKEGEKDECYAIKILKNDKNKSRFEKELEFQKSIDSPYIVPCVCSGKTCDDKIFYIMPRYEKNLRKMMAEKSTGFQKIKWFLDICRAVRIAHNQNIIHRDIKPENIMWDTRNMALGDFGIAHFPDKNITKSGERLANFNYNAPEQKYNSKKGIGTFTDIFALGLILNELFTGELAIGAYSKKIIDASSLFGYLDNIASSMLSNNPVNREYDIQSVINKINFHTENIQKEFDYWKDSVKLPKDILVDEPEKVLEHIYEDLKLADYLINDENTKWSDIDLNYHMNFGYDADTSFLDTVILVKIYENVFDNFRYEGNNYMDGCEGMYMQMDCHGEDKEIFDKFFKIISNLKTISTDGADRLRPLKGQCVKLFSSLYKYHAIEVNDSIEGIIESCYENMLDAPIMWIAGYAQSSIDSISGYIDVTKLKIEELAHINWGRYDSSLVNDNLNRIDNDKNTEFGIISELKRRFTNFSINKSKTTFELYFTIEEWKEYRNLCLSKIDEYDDRKYVLNGDIPDAYRGHIAGDVVLVRLGKHGMYNILPKILFE